MGTIRELTAIEAHIVACAEGCERCLRTADQVAEDPIAADSYEWMASVWSNRAFRAAAETVRL